MCYTLLRKYKLFDTACAIRGGVCAAQIWAEPAYLAVCRKNGVRLCFIQMLTFKVAG